MALKPDRIESHTDISFFMNEVGDRGGVVVHLTGGSGVSMDDANAVVEYSATPSGKVPVGVLMNDVVSLDLTRQHINWHKDEALAGSKVCLLRQGQVTTNMVSGVPTIGQVAYLGVNGIVTPTALPGSVSVGRFISTLDADGYCKLDINIT